MPETINTSFLGNVFESDQGSSGNNEVMIKVDDVTMIFNIASEMLNNLKEYAIALARRELRFKEFRALDHISFEVKKGDVFGILGTNGSGKSTLMKIIAGVLEPSEGSCKVNGNIAPLIELGAGFDMELTARENIYLNGALLGYSKAFINEHFDEIVDFAEVEEFLDMPLKNYSSGMVARIAFAIATVIVPEILIVDEVLSVGDFMFQQKCERRINTLIKEHGVTVLLVSHSNDQIERMCNKAIWIEKGHERIAGNAKQVCEVYRLLGGHFGSLESEQHILDMLQAPKPKNKELVETFTGDTQYSTPVKILRELPSSFSTDKIVVAPGTNHSICMLANAYSSLEDIPILLTHDDRLPDIVEQELQRLTPKHITVLGGGYFVSQNAIDSIRNVAPEANIEVISASSEEDLALAIYEKGRTVGKGWGKQVVYTYKECLGDLISMLPYTYRMRTPILFNGSGQTGRDATLADVLNSGEFSTMLLLGGYDLIPEQSRMALKNNSIEVHMFCGKDPFDANKIINSWIESNIDLQDEIESTSSSIFFIPVWDPSDALAAGPLTKARNATVIVEDTKNLDSVSANLSTIEQINKPLDSLAFFGGRSQFSKSDKEILLKAYEKAQEKH